MPETTNNDAPGADRPTARAAQEGPSPTATPSRPASQKRAEDVAGEAVERAAAKDPAVRRNDPARR